MTQSMDVNVLSMDELGQRGVHEEKSGLAQTQPVHHGPLHLASKAMTDTSYHATHKLGIKYPERNSISPPFRFFDLPAEVRNQIYRDALLTQNAISRVPNPKFFSFHEPAEPLYMDEGEELRRGQTRYVPTVGTVLCENIHVEKSTCNMSLLRVNRRMHQEAAPIFFENIWVAVHINKAGLARELKSRGYNVQVEGWKFKDKVKRALDLNIHIPNSRSRRSDSFLIGLTAIAQLPRALSTLAGFEILEFTFSVRPEFKGKFGPESELVTAFRRLQVLNPVKVSEDDYVFEELAFAMSVLALDLEDDTFHDIDRHHVQETKENRILSRLQENFFAAQEACIDRDWAKAADECELCMAYMNGIYRSEASATLSNRYTVDRSSQIFNRFYDMLLILAEAKLRAGAHACAVKYATHFLWIYHRRTGRSHEDGDNLTMSFFCGRAYAAMREPSMALAAYDDLETGLAETEGYISSLSLFWPDRVADTILSERDSLLKLKARLAEDPPAPSMAYAHLRLEMRVDRLLASDVEDPVCHHKTSPKCYTETNKPCMISAKQHGMDPLGLPKSRPIPASADALFKKKFLAEDSEDDSDDDIDLGIPEDVKTPAPRFKISDF